MMGAAPGKRREDVEASHSKAQHALILAFFGKVGGITRSERADTDLTGQTRKDTGLMNRTSSYNLTEGVPNGECRLERRDSMPHKPLLRFSYICLCIAVCSNKAVAQDYSIDYSNTVIHYVWNPVWYKDELGSTESEKIFRRFAIEPGKSRNIMVLTCIKDRQYHSIEIVPPTALVDEWQRLAPDEEQYSQIDVSFKKTASSKGDLKETKMNVYVDKVAAFFDFEKGHLARNLEFFSYEMMIFRFFGGNLMFGFQGSREERNASADMVYIKEPEIVEQCK